MFQVSRRQFADIHSLRLGLGVLERGGGANDVTHFGLLRYLGIWVLGCEGEESRGVCNVIGRAHCERHCGY